MRPTPTALKKLRDNPGKRPYNSLEPQYPVAAPDKPINLPPQASLEWDRVVPMLVVSGVITRVDRAALTAYCLSWQRLLDAEADIQAHGILIPVMVEDGATGQYINSGNVKKNPAVTVQNEALRNIRAFAAEFGITPASRTRITTGVTQTSSDEDAF